VSVAAAATAGREVRAGEGRSCCCCLDRGGVCTMAAAAAYVVGCSEKLTGWACTSCNSCVGAACSLRATSAVDGFTEMTAAAGTNCSASRFLLMRGHSVEMCCSWHRRQEASLPRSASHRVRAWAPLHLGHSPMEPAGHCRRVCPAPTVQQPVHGIEEEGEVTISLRH
jgi:hypothetical protein